MKFFNHALILLLRLLSTSNYLSSLIYKLLQKSSLNLERLSSVEGYIFGKAKLNNLRNGRHQKPMSKPLRQRLLEIKRGFIALMIFVARGLNKCGLSKLTHFSLQIVDRLPIDIEKKISLYDRIFDAEKNTAQLARSAQFIQFSQIIAGGSPNGALGFDAAKKYNVLHVFVEGDAALPAVLADPNLSHMKFVVHSLYDKTKAINELGLAGRVRTEPLRDKFNEISPEGEEMYGFCAKLSKSVVTSMAHGPFTFLRTSSKRQRSVIAQPLEDLLSSRLSLANCFKVGMGGVPETDAVLFVATSNAYIVNGWSFFKPVLDPIRTFVTYTNPNALRAKGFWAALVTGHTKARHSKKAYMSDSDVAALAIVNTDRSTAFENIQATARQYAGHLSSRLGEETCLILAHASTSPIYDQTYEALGLEAIRSFQAGKSSTPVFLHCLGKEDNRVTPKLMGVEHNRGAIALDFKRFEHILGDQTISTPQMKLILDWLNVNMSREVLYQNADVFNLLSTSISKYFQKQLDWVWVSYTFGLEVGDKVRLQGSLASPSRHWMVRGFCGGLLDSKQSDAPLIDVQSLNTLRHPKYKTPMANLCTVIDNTAANMYHSYFGVPKDSINIVGAPQNDGLQKNLKAIEKDEVRQNFGIKDGQNVVLMISQLQPFKRMRIIAQALGELLRDEPTLDLIVRLHPRENEERKKNYQAEFAKYVPVGRVKFSAGGSPDEVLAISDVCVTLYSNMAREAAIAGKPVIIANFIGWEPPIRLDKDGLARGSISDKKFKRNIMDALDPTSLSKNKRVVPYLIENPHISKGNAVKQIFHFLNERRNTNTLLPITQDTNNIFTDAKAHFHELKSLSIVIASELSAADLPPIFPQEIDITVFSSRAGITNLGFLPANTKIDKGGFNIKSAETIEEAVKKGNDLAQICVDTMLNNFPDTHDAFSLMSNLRYTFWMRIRPRLIRQSRADATIERGIAVPVDAVVLCSENVAMLRYLINKAKNEIGEKSKLLTLLLKKDQSFELMGADEFLERKNAPSIKEIVSVKQSQVDKAFASVFEWYEKAQEVVFDIPKGCRVLALTDWNLKTVPATIAPILQNILEKGEKVNVANINIDALPSINSHFSSRKIAHDLLHTMTPNGFARITPPISGRVLKTLSRFWQGILIEDNEYKNLAPSMQKVMLKSVDVFARAWLRETIMWHLYCMHFLKRRSAVSLACPGRQWHAEVAHAAAGLNDCLSITVQNAYMTAGYTYTKPTGNYITAIDQWSKNVFVKDYGVPAATVKVISTPRFDYLRHLTAMDKQGARKRLKLGANTPFVFFAAQVGFDDETKTIVRTLATLNVSEGLGVECIVKLHPRTPDEVIVQCEHVANMANANHNIKVTKDGEIADYLVASDVVITIFSNVGIEAAVVGRNLIIAKFSDAPLPIPMDEFGIGYVAKDGKMLRDGITAFLEDTDFAKKYKDLQDVYRDENPSMVLGNSAEILTDVVEKAMDGNF